MTDIGSELEIWGGVECTIVRLGESQRNQLEETGHFDREGDIALIAALGIRRIRYPILWEMVSPESAERRDWAWCDRRLALLREAGLDVIAGLVHHGSGPRYTDLLDPRFPELLADHAKAVAERYPWIRHYTPINEPLTTARFSCLYGHWHPHRRSTADFLRAVFHQCKATALSMRAIREVQPEARLVQTEDIGRTFSAPRLAYQANYENERRWLGFDLLLGRVGPQHRFWRDFLKAGVGHAELGFMRQHPCGIDLLGLNHYLTSERYLDDDPDDYPRHFHGGNGRHRYADVEAVRIDLPRRDLGPRARLKEVWDRYGLPMAITEIQHGCNRDDQLRWLHEVVSAVRTLRRQKVDIRAITAWALFGAKDWNTLLTERRGHYEPGAFDIRGSHPRRTAIGSEIERLARRGRFEHPVARGAGWWKRHDRFYRPPTVERQSGRSCRPILVMGDDNMAVSGIAEVAAQRGTPVVQLSVRRLVEEGADLGSVIATLRPWAVLCAGVNQGSSDVAARLAEICESKGIRLAHCSPSRIFGGGNRSGVGESTEPPVNGASTAHLIDAERRVQSLAPNMLVLRHGPLFTVGTSGDELLSTARIRRAGVASEYLVPATFLPDFAHAALDLLCDGEQGLWHLASGRPASWAALATLVERVGVCQYGEEHTDAFDAAALVSERGNIMPTFENAFERFVEAMKPSRSPQAAPTRRTPGTPAPSIPSTWATSASNTAKEAGSYAVESRKKRNVEISTRPLP